jgi:hypothetical protein
VLVERERQPRFHIGESLLPANMPIFERFGVLRLGADFPSSNGQGFNAFRFSSVLGSTPGFAFQVKRGECGELFFRHAADFAGGTTRQEPT